MSLNNVLSLLLISWITTSFSLKIFKSFLIFIESTPGKLLDLGSVSYPTLVKIFYCNLSFITLDGFPALRSYVKGQELVIIKTLINELFKFSNVADVSTQNSVALLLQKICLF